MKKITIASILILCSSLYVQAQQVAGKLLDEKTNTPIPYATIAYGTNQGTISNEEGVFYILDTAHKIDSVEISSMGYKTVRIAVNDLENNPIYLGMEDIALGEIVLFDKALEVTEIIDKVKDNITKNYGSQPYKQTYFFRDSYTNIIKNISLDVDESTIPELDQKLMDSMVTLVPRSSAYYTEILGTLYGNYDQNKVSIKKVADLYDPEADASFTDFSKRLEKIFKENVKGDSYLKIKSGIIGTKVDVSEVVADIDSVPDPEVARAERLKKRREHLIGSSSYRMKTLFDELFWKDDATIDILQKSGRYNFVISGYTISDDEVLYKIDFEPKGNADYKGTLYVNTVDYAVHKLEFQNVKQVGSLKLFGISRVKDVRRGKMIFSKHASGGYLPKYLEFESGETYGIDRPLTIIEKNKNVAGRRKQNEFDMDVSFRNAQRNKFQAVFYDASVITSAEVENLEPNKDFEIKDFKAYNAAYWSGENIIPPNEAIKAFTVQPQEKE